MTQTELLQEVLELIESAIKAGDWVVDGACDPELTIHRIKKALAQPEQEPVAKVIDWGIEGPRLKGLTEDWPRVGTLLYACPPQRTWVGLTDEERNDCLVDADPCECLATPEAEELMRCIEAKLKEKNT